MPIDLKHPFSEVRDYLAAELGITGFGQDAVWLREEWKRNGQLAMDAQPALFTTPSSGIPAFLTNLIDPQEINILYTPMRATEVYGEEKRGSWTDLTAQFPIVEMTGFVTSYGDFNNDGDAGANINWEPRQSYYFQTILQYGERETDMYALARLNLVSMKNVAAAFVISKFFNQSYLFGIAGLLNYGMINDPSLITPISPTTGVGGNTWALKTSQEIFNDFLALFKQLQVQLGGLATQDMELTVAMSPGSNVYLSKINAYMNVSALTAIKTAFPNIKFVLVPEYATAGGELVQLIVNRIDNVETGITAFTEKMRAHPVIPDLSSSKTKRSAGTWGSIIKRPIAIAQMLGV